MDRKRLWLAGWLGMGIVTGCPGEGEGDLRPFEDEWRLELDVPFPYVDGSAQAAIESLTIGGQEINDNFANRGDVIVQFSGQDSRIRVEVRRHAMATSEASAQEVFAALKLIAARGGTPTAQPSPENSCMTTWQDECHIRIGYDGLTQVSRSGADLRVTLPWFYRHLITVITEDSLAESSYSRRSDVCVQGLNASADIQLGSGRTFVVVADDATPMPQCEFVPGGFEDCNTYPGGAWAPGCACIAQNGNFGRVRVSTWDASSTNATVDLPANLWTSVSLVNEGAGQLRGVDPPCLDQSLAGDRCDACPEIAGFMLDPYLGTDATRPPWLAYGYAAKPSDAAVSSAGFLVDVASNECDLVRYTSNPADFVGVGNGEDQAAEERGNVRVCSNCIRASTCDALLGP